MKFFKAMRLQLATPSHDSRSPSTQQFPFRTEPISNCLADLKPLVKLGGCKVWTVILLGWRCDRAQSRRRFPDSFETQCKSNLVSNLESDSCLALVLLGLSGSACGVARRTFTLFHLNVVQSLVMSCFPSFLSCGRGRATLLCVLGPPLLPNRFSALTAAWSCTSRWKASSVYHRRKRTCSP